MSFSNILIYWYLQNKRDLPWRENHDPYAIWLSEIILQQTRIEQGLSYYLKFLNAFPTVFDLAKADEESILKLWQGLGYYSRARNLHYSAKYIVNEQNGKFPNTYKNLLELKGVGDYTASAIASICFGEPTAVVDGNVYRVLARYLGIQTPINSSQGIKEFKQVAQSLIDPKQPGTFNQALMEFGSLQCKPQNPDCTVCPLNSGCSALAKNMIKNLPVKYKSVKVKTRYFNYLVLAGKKTILQKRTGNGIWNRLYEFPLVESDQDIGINELVKSQKFKLFFGEEKTSISLYNLTPIIHKLSHQHLVVKFWIINSNKKFENSIFWSGLDQYPVPILIANFVENFKNCD
ncbi:MAG: A/G-specific adenine glycosylase [Flavobacteriaceae bacterium]|nr:A/G-specific adenine glycosylase [Flavobacteriaceae bacterium]